MTAADWLALACKASVVLAAAAGVDLVSRRRSWFSAAERHGLWSAAFVLVLALPLAELFVPDRVLAELPVAVPQRIAQGGQPSREPDRLTLSSPRGLARAVPTSNPWTAAWLLGATALGLRFVLAAALLERRARRGVRVTASWRREGERTGGTLELQRPVRLRFADVATPMTYGWRRPTLLLPREAASWSASEREVVLLHELAHVKRGDHLANWIANAACIVLWFHPLAWWGRARQRLDRELACDDWVLARGAGALDYAEHLVGLARRLPRRAARHVLASGMGGRHELQTRVHALLDDSRRRSAPGSGARRAGLVAAAVSALALASFELVGERSPLERGDLADWMAAAHHDDPRVREEAAWLLGRAADRRGFYELLQLWDDPAPRVRETAVWAMARINCAPAFLTLSSCLDHPDVRVRARAAEFLRSFPAGWERQVPLQLVPRAFDYSWRRLREEFFELPSQTAVERVGALLSDPDPSVRREASSTLRAWGAFEPGANG